LRSILRGRDTAAAVAIFIFFWLLYLLTLSPGILFEDSGELALGNFFLGVSHPPGYPLFNLIGKLFQFLPAGEAAFRANMMSAFLGALAVAVLFAAARGFQFSLPAAIIGACACGVSRTIWSQAIIDEVYMLNMLVNAGLLWALAGMVGERLNTRRALAAAALLGLSATNHYVTPAAFLPVMLAVFFSGRGISRFSRTLAVFTGGLMAAASLVCIYAYIPLRAASNPVMNWMNPRTVPLFIDHVRRAQFGQFENQLRFHIPTISKYFSSFIENLSSEFFLPLLFLGIVGAIVIATERRKAFLAFLWLFLVQSLGILMYVRFHADDAGLSVVRVFYIGSYLVVGIMISAGVDALLSRLSQVKLGSILRPGLAAALAALLAIPLYTNFQKNDLSRETRTRQFGIDLFRYLRRDSVLYLQGSQFTSPSIYFRFIQNLRPDVTLIDSSGNLLRDELVDIAGEFEFINIDMVVDSAMKFYAGRNYQAMTYPRPFQGLASNVMMRGPFFYLSDEPGCRPEGWAPDKYGMTPETTRYRDFEIRLLIPILKARKAECHFLEGDFGEGLDEVRDAVDSLKTSAHVRLYAGQLADRYGFDNIANEYYNQALELCPTYTDAMIQKAQLLIEQQGEKPADERSYTAAEELFKKVLDISPGHIQAKLSLANIASRNEDYPAAEKLYKDLIRQYPDSVIVHVNLANLYLNMRRFKEAEIHYEKAVEIDPDSALTVLNFSTYLMNAGKVEKARRLLQNFLIDNPDSAYAHYNLGLAFHSAGNYNVAVEHYRKAVEFAPSMVQAWQNLVLTLEISGRLEESVKTLVRMKKAGIPALERPSEGLWMKLVTEAEDSGETGRLRTVLEQMASSGGDDASLAADLWAKVVYILLETRGLDRAREELLIMNNTGLHSIQNQADTIKGIIEEVEKQ